MFFQVISRYDVVLIQEIRDATATAIFQLGDLNADWLPLAAAGSGK